MSVRFWVCILLVLSAPLTAQDRAVCKGPAKLESILSSHPSASAYSALGAHFSEQHQTDCAVSAFESAISLDPNSWEAHYNLGLALLEKKDPARALPELRVVARQKADVPMVRNALGTALEELGQSA